MILFAALAMAQPALAQKGDPLSGKERNAVTGKFISADKERLLGNLEEAYRLYATCVEMDPQLDAAYFQMARIVRSTGDVSTAMRYYDRASKLDPHNKWYQLEYADFLTQTGQYKPAARLYESLIEAYPYDAQYRLSFAGILLVSGKEKQAMKAFDEFERLAGVNKEIRQQKYQYYLQTEQWGEAERELVDLIRLFPEDVTHYEQLANLYQRQQRWDEALQVFKSALRQEPGQPAIMMAVADYYDRTLEPDSSAKYLEGAFRDPMLDIDHKVGRLLRMYPVAERNESMRKQCLRLCDILCETHPDDAKSFSVSGDFLYLNLDRQRARERYREALALDASKFAVWNQLLLIDSELGDFQSLQRDSREALEVFPTQPTVYLFSGIANTRLEAYDIAVRDLRAGADMVLANPALSAQLLAALGDAYHEMGRFSSSDSAFDVALGHEPRNPYILNNYAYYLSLRDAQLEKALEMSALCVQKAPRNATYLDTHAWVLYRLGRYDEARQQLEQAFLYGGGKHAEIVEHYGDVLFRLGRVAEAVEQWRLARDLGSTSVSLNKKIEDRNLND